jgi:NADPH:quinone reductase-like Zn-dependent oxidoreductase
MSEIPPAMKAWIAVRPGQPKDALELRTDWPTPPPPKLGELMIKISYAALNPGDLRLMSWKIPFKWKLVTGMDFVGEVVQVGALTPTSTSNARCGMIVAGTVPLSYMWHGVGTLAEYIVLPAQAVVEKPGDLEEAVAAGLFGIAGQTCAVSLRHANLCKGDRVLVNGASGGVGSLLIQPLCAMGVHVTAVCSKKNEALVRMLGAEEVRSS